MLRVLKRRTTIYLFRLYEVSFHTCRFLRHVAGNFREFVLEHEIRFYERFLHGKPVEKK